MRCNLHTTFYFHTTRFVPAIADGLGTFAVGVGNRAGCPAATTTARRRPAVQTQATGKPGLIRRTGVRFY
jgi:hypothetical protein